MADKDETLVAQCLKGERHAYNALVQKYQTAAFGLAFSFVHNADDASDVVQDAFVSVYLNLEQLKEPARFGGWFRTILANRAKKWYRSRREHVALTSAHVELGQKAVNRFAQDQYRQGVWEQVRSLDEIYSVPVTLFYGSGLSYDDIATFLDVPVSTVRGRLQKARQKLKDVLTEDLNMAPIDVSENVQEEICKIARAEIYKEIEVGKHKHLVLSLGIPGEVSVVQGEGDKVVVRGHKVAVGENEKKAELALENMKLLNDEVNNWIAGGYHEGERFGGTNSTHEKPQALVTKSKGRVKEFYGQYQKFWRAFYPEDAFPHFAPSSELLAQIQDVFTKEAHLVSVVFDKVIDIVLPKSAVNDAVLEGLHVNNESNETIHGPVGRVVLEVLVPVGVSVTLKGVHKSSVKGIEGNLLCLRGNVEIVEDVVGDVFVLKSFVKRMRNIDGNVTVFEQSFPNNSGQANPGNQREMFVDGVVGSLALDVGYIHLDIANVSKNICVQNRLGNTKLQMREWGAGSQCRVQTVSGNLSFCASREVLAKRTIAGAILIGTMDYKRLHDVIPAFQQANSQQLRYFSTATNSKDHWKDADIFLTCESGHLEVKHFGKVE